MKINPKRHGEQINTLIQVWTALNPMKSCSGLSLSEVREGFKASLESRMKVATAQAELAAALRDRDLADEETYKYYKRVLSAIKADAQEGENGPLLKAIISGTRKSRRSGMVHSTPTPAPVLSVVKPAA